MRILKIENLRNKDWVDADDLMLSACFQVFKNFVEEERPEKHFKTRPELFKEVMILYVWWNKRSKISIYDSLDGKTIVKQINQDERMLRRLIKIRCHLWT